MQRSPCSLRRLTATQRAWSTGLVLRTVELYTKYSLKVTTALSPSGWPLYLHVLGVVRERWGPDKGERGENIMAILCEVTPSCCVSPCLQLMRRWPLTFLLRWSQHHIKTQSAEFFISMMAQWSPAARSHDLHVTLWSPRILLIINLLLTYRMGFFAFGLWIGNPKECERSVTVYLLMSRWVQGILHSSCTGRLNQGWLASPSGCLM